MYSKPSGPKASFEPKCGLPVLQLSATNRSFVSVSALPSNRPRSSAVVAPFSHGLRIGEVQPPVLAEPRVRQHLQQAALPCGPDVGVAGDRLGIERAVADDAKAAGPLGDEHVAVGQEREAPRIHQPADRRNHPVRSCRSARAPVARPGKEADGTRWKLPGGTPLCAFTTSDAKTTMAPVSVQNLWLEKRRHDSSWMRRPVVDVTHVLDVNCYVCFPNCTKKKWSGDRDRPCPPKSPAGRRATPCAEARPLESSRLAPRQSKDRRALSGLLLGAACGHVRMRR